MIRNRSPALNALFLLTVSILTFTNTNFVFALVSAIVPRSRYFGSGCGPRRTEALPEQIYAAGSDQRRSSRMRAGRVVDVPGGNDNRSGGIARCYPHP
jgi:hypothetical protein